MNNNDTTELLVTIDQLLAVLNQIKSTGQMPMNLMAVVLIDSQHQSASYLLTNTLLENDPKNRSITSKVTESDLRRLGEEALKWGAMK